MIITNFFSSVFNYFNPRHEPLVTDLSASDVSYDLAESLPNPKKELQSIIDEMNRRATDFGYGLKFAQRREFTKLERSSKEEEIYEKLSRISSKKKELDVKTDKKLKHKVFSELSKEEPYLPYHRQLFPHKTARILYLSLDPGVDDALAKFQLLAASKVEKVKVVGVVPSVGNAVLSQTIENAQKLLELSDDRNIPVYPGALAPLDIENNGTAIAEMSRGINATHFYGHDGLADIGGWPSITRGVQPIPGYQFGASLVCNASVEDPITIVATSSVTELSKVLSTLEVFDVTRGEFSRSCFKNINAISIMGGCIDPKVGCNAPFNVPDKEKTSEANFYFDPLAAQKVFSISQKHGIPILLAPLDLTQEQGLLWTKKQVKLLEAIGNPVAKQVAKLTDVVPYIDAFHFPNGTYPMHDLHAAAALIFPGFYSVTRIAANISAIGEVLINHVATEAQKNIYVLGMPTEKQEEFYDTVLAEYRHFDCVTGDTAEKCREDSFGFKMREVVMIAASGVAALTLGIFCALRIQKCRRRRMDRTLNEKSSLLEDAVA